MPEFINPIITDAGLTAAVNAQANGVALAITHIALGTGKYTADVATVSGMTNMVARREFKMPGIGVVSGSGGFVITPVFSSWPNTPYDATEVGFWSGEPGTPGAVLFAVYSHPTAVLVQRNSLDYLPTYLLQLTRVPAGSVTVHIDPDAAQWMAMLNQHLNASDPHPQYLKRTGDTSSGVQLGVTAPQHDDTKKFSTTEWVNRVGVNFPSQGYLLANVDLNLGIESIGRWVSMQRNGGYVRLPATSLCRVGAAYKFRCDVANASIVTTGADLFITPINGVGNTNVLPVTQGETITVSRNEQGQWHVIEVSARLPVGMTSMFAGSVAPPGWIHLNGALLSRAGYPALWAYAQQSEMCVDSDWINNGYFGRFSTGTAGDNFRIPDTRGLFLRAFDEGRGFDPSRPLGRFQDHDNVAHVHSAWTDVQGDHVHNLNTSGVRYNATFIVSPGEGTLHSGSGAVTSSTTQNGAHGHNVGIGASGGSDGRPRNLPYRHFMKY